MIQHYAPRKGEKGTQGIYTGDYYNDPIYGFMWAVEPVDTELPGCVVKSNTWVMGEAPEYYNLGYDKETTK